MIREIENATMGSFSLEKALSIRLICHHLPYIMEILPEVQNAIDAAASNELESWNAVIPFSVIKKPYSVEPEHCDNILDFLQVAWDGCKFYFPPSKYALMSAKTNLRGRTS